MYEKVLIDLHELEKQKNKIIKKKKDEIKEFELKITKHYNLKQIKPILFLDYDFKDFQSSMFNVFTQELLNDQIEVK